MWRKNPEYMENKNITFLAEYEPETLVMDREPSLKLQ